MIEVAPNDEIEWLITYKVDIVSIQVKRDWNDTWKYQLFAGRNNKV